MGGDFLFFGPASLAAANVGGDFSNVGGDFDFWARVSGAGGRQRGWGFLVGIFPSLLASTNPEQREQTEEQSGGRLLVVRTNHRTAATRYGVDRSLRDWLTYHVDAFEQLGAIRVHATRR